MSLVPCQLCGVPFKIGRLRTQFEPRAAAWSPDNGDEPLGHDESYGCEQEGCKIAFRHRNPEDQTPKELSKDGTLDVFADIVPSGVDREGNEVSFNAWLTLHDLTSDSAGDWGPSRWDNKHGEAYLSWFEGKTQDGRKNPHSRSRSFQLSQEKSADYIEHIAGVDCGYFKGFNGNAISAEEMRLCSTAQYIVIKDGDFHRDLDDSPEPDDEDFERESNYVLSGLATRTDGLEGNCSVSPVRHGLSGNMSPQFLGGFDQGDLIFHPHCLEIYKRVSALRLGGSEVTHVPAFADWWTSDGKHNEPPYHQSILAVSGQWFEHTNGHEFVAANPLQVPALTAILEAARRPHEGFDASKNSPFGAKEVTGTSNTQDVFGKLPSELRDMVVSSLNSKEIANLRLASRTFRHLPITLWHDLLKKEAPWVWEAWSDRPYPYMSCTTEDELEARDQAVKARVHAIQGLGDEQKANQKKLIIQKERQFREPRAVQQLDRLKTDWHYLYCQLAREWKNIKGLQNRERIWKTIEFIVRRIADPDEEDPYGAHNKAFPFRGP